MHRRQLFAMAPALALTATAPATASASPADDAADVAALLAEYQAAWAASDAARMFRIATDDIHWVNVVGMHWQGKADVEEAHRVYLETLFRGVPMALEAVESVVPIGADVLAVVARWSVGAYTTPSGFEAPASIDRMSLILKRTPEGLRMAHVANIEVNARAQASNPIRPAPDAA